MHVKTNFSLPMTLALVLAGLCLCFVSVYYTVDLLSTLGSDNREKSLMTVTAIGFEACKFAFVPIGLALYTHKKLIRGSALFFLGSALVGVSMVASLGFLAAKTDQGIETAKIESDEYKAYQSRLRTIDQSIDMLSSAAAIDANSQWRKARENASKRVAEIKALEQERSQTLQVMANVDATTKTDTGALFVALGNGWGMSAERVKKLCYIIVAALLELCSIAALSLAGVAAIKVASPSTPTTTSKRRWSLPRFSNPRLGSWFSGGNVSESTSQNTATGASTEAVKGQKQSTATVHDLNEFAVERERAEQSAQSAKQAKVEALKAQSAMTKEAKILSDQTQQLRKEVAEHTAMLKKVKSTPIEKDTIRQKKSKKRLKALSTQPKSAFDQNLYLCIKQDIENGQLKHSIRAIQRAHSIGFPKAQMYYHKLIKDGVVSDQHINSALS